MSEKTDKRLKDVSRNQWENLAAAALNALMALRFQLWLHEDEDDGSLAKACDELANAFDDIGIPQISQKQFNANVESMLTSGLSPDEWSAKQEQPK